MEDALRGPAVARGIVADTLMDAVRAQDRGFELILIRWQRKHAGDAVALHDQCADGHKMAAIRENLRRDILAEIVAEKRINGCVHRTQVIGKQAGFFLEICN